MGTAASSIILKRFDHLSPSGRPIETEESSVKSKFVHHLKPLLLRGTSVSSSLHGSRRTPNTSECYPSLHHPILSRCLPEDVLRLEKGDIVLLVLSEESNLFPQYYRRKLIDGYDSTFMRGSKKLVQVPCTVKANSHGLDVLNGIYNEPSIKRFLSQGEGLALYPVNDQHVIEVRWAQILHGTIELWGYMNDTVYSKDFYSVFRGRRNFATVAPVLHQLLKETEHDVVQTLELKAAHYQTKCKRLTDRVSDLESKLDALQAVGTAKDTHKALVRQALELVSKEIAGAESFIDDVGNNYQQAFENHAGAWHTYSEVIIPTSMEKYHLERYHRECPLVSSALRILMGGAGDESQGQKSTKAFKFFLAMARNRNKNNLVYWASVETLALMGKGITREQIKPSQKRRFAASPQKVDGLLLLHYQQSKHRGKLLLSKEPSLTEGADNYQTVTLSKFQDVSHEKQLVPRIKGKLANRFNLKLMWALNAPEFL